MVRIRPHRDRCRTAMEARQRLQEAHDACFKAKDRGVLGTSSGPFSGVNQVLGLIAFLDAQVAFEKRRADYAGRSRLRAKPKVVRK